MQTGSTRREDWRFSIVRHLMHFLLPALLLASRAWAAEAPGTIIGRVVSVADGDTIAVLAPDKRQHRVRLSGIDAPEKGQPHGQAAKKHLSDLVFGKIVTVEGRKIDRYGRTVARVLVGSQDVGLEQLRAGLAWHYKRFEEEQPEGERSVYAMTEIDARKAIRGLWRDRDPLPPWDWRKR